MLIRRTVAGKPEPGASIRDKTGAINRIAARIRQCMLVLFCLLAAHPALTQEAGVLPLIGQQEIENCLTNDIRACPLEMRLQLIGNIASQMEDIAGQIGLFCELEPLDCPDREGTARLHVLNQSLDELIWGLPQYRIMMLNLRNQTGVVDRDAMPDEPLEQRVIGLEPAE